MATQDIPEHTSAHGAAGASEPLLDTPTEVTADETYDDQDDRSKEHYEFESPPRPWWKGNINLYLGIVYVYMIWFVCTRGPWRFTNGEPISAVAAVHVVNACIYGLACCANIFHTPKHGSVYRDIHMNLGRFGNAAGVVSVFTGMIVLYAYDNPLGMRIGLTVGGVLQIYMQVLGMRALFQKERDLKKHAYYMKQALFFACLIPALMRLPMLTGFGIGDYWQGIAWIFAFPIYHLSEYADNRGKFF